MYKIETIWHHILLQPINKKEFRFTQQNLAKILNCSLSTVNHALKVPSEIGAIRKTPRFFILENYKKLLFYWASKRSLVSDIIYQTYVDEPVLGISSRVPDKTIFGCYSAARYHFDEVPADYDKVFIYSDNKILNQVKERFLLDKKNKPNFFVLKMPNVMSKYGQFTTLPQTFVDIWNLKDWYAQDFIKALEEKIYGLLS